jgi:glycosyltransferase involved in cell wall biosynthesis
LPFTPYSPEITSFYAYYGGYIVRKFCSVLPLLGVVPKANTFNRTPGISAIVRIRNEPWIVPSLLSLKGFADEIIVVDSSDDDTPDKVRKVMEETDLNIRYTHKGCDIKEASELAIQQSSHEWLLKWDGDFIGYESRLRKLRQKILGLPKERYCFIEFPLLCLDVDLFHLHESGVYDPYQVEPWIYRYSPSLSHGFGKKEKVEVIQFPRYYEKKYFGKNIYVMHLRTVKPIRKFLQRTYQVLWMHEDKTKYSNSFEEYLNFCVKRDYGCGLEEVSKVMVERFKQKLTPYNKAVYGDYPPALKRYAKQELGLNL